MSGALYNPAITLGYFLYADTNVKINRLLTVLYIFVQFLGAFAGAIVSWILTKESAAGY